jgi:hypothetical protein
MQSRKKLLYTLSGHILAFLRTTRFYLILKENRIAKKERNFNRSYIQDFISPPNLNVLSGMKFNADPDATSSRLSWRLVRLPEQFYNASWQ